MLKVSPRRARLSLCLAKENEDGAILLPQKLQEAKPTVPATEGTVGSALAKGPLQPFARV
jgi:hypothetical protein